MRTTFIFLILSSISLLGQQSINNNVTNNHTRVDGTNLYLILPPGFDWVAQSRKFINSKINTAIIINVMETTIDQLQREMSKNVLLSQGSIWLSETPVTVNNLNGYLIETKRQTFHDKFLSHTLIFGKGKMCYVVQTIFPESNKQFENQSYQIIKSVVYKDVIPNSKNYSMHFAQYSFEFSESKNNVDYYQCGNNISISVEPFFTKGNTDPGVIFYNRMQRLPFSSIELAEKGVEEIEISSLAGLQAVVIAINKNGERIYVYQSLLTEGGKHYWILGIVQSEAEVARLVELVKIFKH